jgi:predicted glycosyltransferase
MSTRPRLLFYCQHSLGLGHLARSLALCQALARRFDVTLLSGGTLPPGIAPPDGVELVPLPSLTLAPDGQLVADGAGRDLDAATRERRARMLHALRASQPRVLVVELFPFGRKKFAGELEPLIEAARSQGALVACSLRDILVSRGERQAAHDERAARVVNRLFDAVLVHSDPRFARLDESFRPDTRLRVPVHHTGFVLPPAPHSGGARRDRVVVSAGGGRVGEPLLRAAVGAHEPGTPMTVVAGPFLPEETWRSLRGAAHSRRGLELVRCVPDLEAELQSAAASVSQCGYNTALEVVRSGVPALFVPFAAPGEDEQTRRAARLAALGCARMLHAHALDSERLAAELRSLRAFTPARTGLDMDGAERSAERLEQLVRGAVAA